MMRIEPSRQQAAEPPGKSADSEETRMDIERLENEAPTHVPIVAVETVDKMTDPQIAAKARDYSRQPLANERREL